MKKAMKQGFSLIELMIVVVIIGALTAIIIPQFSASESEALDTGCDASNYGTLKQLINFKSINGVYPSRLHTGYETDASGAAIMGTTADSAIAPPTAANFTNVASTVASVLTEDQADSLAAAGIDVLAYGGFGIDAVFDGVGTNAYVQTVTADWLEDQSDSGTSVTINGLPIFAYAARDPQLDYATSDTSTSDLDDVDGIVVPLFAAPTADWDNAVIDGDSFESRVGVAQAGGCPWLEGGEQFRYYICFFKVYNDGSAAKLIGTACPECGSLNP